MIQIPDKGVPLNVQIDGPREISMLSEVGSFLIDTYFYMEK